jgi:tetratricopeptide (TPR) repeat protein
VTRYLDAIRDRAITDATPNARSRLIDGRLVLARAMAIEAATLPGNLAANRRDGSMRSWLVDRNDASIRQKMQQAVTILELAATFSETAMEASVRRAFLLYRLGSSEQALHVIDQTGELPDPVVGYWKWLVRGRVLASLNRTDEAIKSYQQAAKLQPTAQTPAVALSALLLQSGNHAEAVSWADIARTRPGQSVDPWFQYWSGDARFLAVWLKELRGASQ